MAEPIRLARTAYALVDDGRRPEVGDVLTVAIRGAVALELEATVVALEIDDDGEHAILVDEGGARWALPVQPAIERGSP